MGKPANAWMGMQKKKWSLMVLALFSLSTAMVFFMRTAFDSCNANTSSSFEEGRDRASELVHSAGRAGSGGPSPLDFMKSKLVLLVSHELSLSGKSHFSSLFFFFFSYVSRNWKGRRKVKILKKKL